MSRSPCNTITINFSLETVIKQASHKAATERATAHGAEPANQRSWWVMVGAGFGQSPKGSAGGPGVRSEQVCEGSGQFALHAGTVWTLIPL